MTFGDQVRWLRKHRGMSQAELASRIRVRRRAPVRSYVTQIESGRIDPTLSTIRSLARALKVRPWQLVAGLGESVRFWEAYLDLTSTQKREVQRHIDYLYRGHR